MLPNIVPDWLKLNLQAEPKVNLFSAPYYVMLPGIFEQRISETAGCCLAVKSGVNTKEYLEIQFHSWLTPVRIIDV